MNAYVYARREALGRVDAATASMTASADLVGGDVAERPSAAAHHGARRRRRGARTATAGARRPGACAGHSGSVMATIPAVVPRPRSSSADAVVGDRRRRSASRRPAARRPAGPRHDDVVQHRREGGDGEAPPGVEHRGAERRPPVEEHLRQEQPQQRHPGVVELAAWP